MHDHENPDRCAEPEQHESIFLIGVLRIHDQERVLIDEDGLGFLE
jgi:hypothetical protein